MKLLCYPIAILILTGCVSKFQLPSEYWTENGVILDLKKDSTYSIYNQGIGFETQGNLRFNSNDTIDFICDKVTHQLKVNKDKSPSLSSIGKTNLKLKIKSDFPYSKEFVSLYYSWNSIAWDEIQFLDSETHEILNIYENDVVFFKTTYYKNHTSEVNHIELFSDRILLDSGKSNEFEIEFKLKQAFYQNTDFMKGVIVNNTLYLLSDVGFLSGLVFYPR